MTSDPAQTLAAPDAQIELASGSQLERNFNDLPPQADKDILPVVGLGGSAGSIKPLQQFFGLMAPDSGLAFVVVVHLDPHHDSMLAQILQARTQMPVVQVLEPTEVQANHVYVIPPGPHLAMREGKILLFEPDHPKGKRVAVDLFFRSLAASQRSHSVAVVLSGIDSDGSIGIKRIKEVGGVTIVQAPEEAEQDGMPRSALDTGMVDWVLPIEAMPDKLLEFARNEKSIQFPPEAAPVPRPAEPEPSPKSEFEPSSESNCELDEVALRDILTMLLAHTGHDFSHYKRPTVLRRIGRRLQVNSLSTFPQYAEFLRTHIGEAGALLADLLISVTNFFRDKEAFAALESHIPRLFRDKSARDTICVWVPGCATGEEAYSIGMLLLEHASTLEAPPSIQIFATDIDDEATRFAREGLYPAAIAADLSTERLRRFFSSEAGRYRVRKEVRELILFASHNLLKDSPFSRLDLVSCRNLLIYFEAEAQDRVLQVFHFALGPDALLFLGTSESAEEPATLFAPLDKEHRIFERQAASRPHFLPLPPPSSLRLAQADSPVLPHNSAQAASTRPSTSPRRSAPVGGRERASASFTSFGELHLQLLEQYGPPSILVNGAHEIVHISPRASRYLRLAPGEISINLFSMVHPALRLELRSAMFLASQSGEPALVQGIPAELDSAVRLVDIRVRPMRQPGISAGATPTGTSTDTPGAAPSFLLVIFEESAREVDSSSESALNGDARAGTGEDESVSRQLESEILHLKSSLRDTAQQYEVSVEELKASHEELQSMNEELRSAGEELEIGKEEIQAVNEELSTLNAELRSKVEEVSRVNSDLGNLMASTGIATVFLDSSLCIKRYTPQAVELFNLIPTDSGRPLSDLRHLLLGENLTRDAAQVLAGQPSIEREVWANDGRCFVLRVLPYRLGDSSIDGVVLTFNDITSRQQAEEMLRESEESHRLIIDGVQEHAIFALDAGGRVTSWNRAAQSVLGYSEAEVLGHPGSIFFTPEDQRAGWPQAELSEAEREGRASSNRWHRRSDGSLFFATGTTSALRHEDGGLRGFVKVVRDDTESKRAEEALLASARHASFLTILDGALRPLRDPDEIQKRASQVLGEHLGASRVCYAEFEEDGDHTLVHSDYNNSVPSVAGRHRLGDYGSFVAGEVRAGHALVIEDSACDPRLDGASREACAKVQVRALILVPLLRAGRLAVLFMAERDHPYTWSQQEMAIVQETAERAWGAVERERAQATLRESEERYHTLFNSIDEGFCVIEMIFDEQHRAVDFLVAEANPAFERHNGIQVGDGKTMRQLVPELEEHWYQTYGQVALSGEPTRFQAQAVATPSSGWFDVCAFRLGGACSRRVGVLLSNITERKRSEQNAALLASVSADLTRLSSAHDIMEAVGRKTYEHFGLSRLNFSYIDQSGSQAIGVYEKRDSSTPNSLGTHRLCDYIGPKYLEQLQSGQIVAIDDVQADSETGAGSQVLASFATRSQLMAPFQSDGRWKFLLVASHGQPHAWQADEIELLHELSARIYARIERASAEELLRASEERFRTLVSKGADMITVTNREGRVLYASPPTERVTGYTSSEFMALSPFDLIHPDDRAMCQQALQVLVATPGLSLDLQHRGRRKDGSWHWVEGTFTSLFHDPAIGGLVANIRDITERKQSEAALRLSQERLHLLSENVHDFVIIWSDTKGRTTEWSVGSQQVLGWAPEEMLGQTVHLMFTPEDVAAGAVEQERETAEREGRASDERWHRRKDDSRVFLSGVMTPLRDEEGCLQGFVKIARDVTEAKKVEEALHKSEERLRIAVEAGNLGTCDWDYRTGQEQWNAIHFQQFGMEPRQGLLSLDEHISRIHPGDQERVRRELTSQIESCGAFEIEFRVVRESDGALRWLNDSGRVIEREGGSPAGSTGKPTRVAGIALDITARREAEAALRESEERMRIAVDAGGLGTWEWDLERDEVRWNERHSLLFGMGPREGVLSSGDFISRVHPGDRSRVSEQLMRAVETGGLFEAEFRILRDDNGEVRWMSDYGRVVEARGGRATRMSGVMYDTTERHEATQVLRRSRDEMEKLVSERSGELERVNRALQAEVWERKSAEAGREQLLRRLVSTQEGERRRISRELHDQMGQTLTALMMGLKSLPDIPDSGLKPPNPNETVQRLQTITGELMDEVHHLAWELRPAVLDNLGLREALEQYVREWEKRNSVRVDFLSHGMGTERLPEHIESTLYRVVQEALTNVARHAKASHASVLLERVEGEVVAIVEDDGAGFEAEATSQSEASGGRLGVAGMRERVEIVGGTLTIESGLGTGTTLYARVPIERPGTQRSEDEPPTI